MSLKKDLKDPKKEAEKRLKERVKAISDKKIIKK
jgi:hypothetical protein